MRDYSCGCLNYLLITIYDLQLSNYLRFTINDLLIGEQLCQILSDDIQKLAAASAARTMRCVYRRQVSVPIARSPACNTASVRSVAITRTGRWCG